MYANPIAYVDPEDLCNACGHPWQHGVANIADGTGTVVRWSVPYPPWTRCTGSTWFTDVVGHEAELQRRIAAAPSS
jgi:hypothetical protein